MVGLGPGAKSGPKGPARGLRGSRGQCPYLGARGAGFGFADVSKSSNITNTRRSTVRMLLVVYYDMFNFELL